jgi:preprotein translocase subunit SecD
MPNKNVLALLSAVLTAILLGAAVWTHGEPLPALSATVAALAAVTWGVKPSPRRSTLWMLVLAVGSGALFVYYDNFWGLFVAGLAFVWLVFGLLPVMDSGWRLRLGFVVAVFVGGALMLWPTVDGVMPAVGSEPPQGSGPEAVLGRALHGIGVHLHCPRYLKDRVTFAIAPGLDLSGGLRLVYTVEVEEAIRDKRDNFADEMRQQLGTLLGVHSGEGRLTHDELPKLEARVHVATPDSAVIRLKFKDKADKGKLDDRFNKSFLSELSESQGPEDDEVSFKIRADVESQIRERAVAQAKETVSRRVDGLGLREASVTTRDEDIIVEVPGSDQQNFASIKDTIRQTARLEFKMVDDAGSQKVFGPPALKEDELPEGEGLAMYQEQAPDGLDSSGHKKSAAAAYVRLTCQPPKYPTESLQDCLKRFKTWAAQNVNIPDDHVIGYEGITEAVENSEPLQFKQVGWRTLYLYSRAELTGDYIVDAQTTTDQQNFGAYQVALSFSPAGGDRFEEVTGANVNRRFAIILDDEVNSAPVIRQKIQGGRATISMGAGDQEKQLHDARNLELVLQSGALPAPISPSSESVIGPSLGRDSIAEALKGGVIGAGAVLVFMLVYYRRSGLVADVAVMFNLMLQLAVLATFGATMTLPGLAGLALTIGMSVDGNVLINERIREELRVGKSIRAAVDQGYTRAWPSIIDGHATVAISALILMNYGTGPVKGFAVTLFIGILCSLFTGFFCTRVVFDWWVRGAKVKRLSVGAEF